MSEIASPHISAPRRFDAAFAATLRTTKSQFLSTRDGVPVLLQHGAATLDMSGWPGWPAGLSSTDAVIETYVASKTAVQPTSENEPFVSTWLPLVQWMDAAVRSALVDHNVELATDAYVTASLTNAATLEGTAHMDDDTFVPDDSVSVVAIIGQHVGPRIATGQLTPEPLRPMSQVIWSADQLTAFQEDQTDHCLCSPDQLVIFPQFGQLHAGPATSHLAGLKAAATRQLLVYRAAAVTTQADES